MTGEVAGPRPCLEQRLAQVGGKLLNRPFRHRSRRGEAFQGRVTWIDRRLGVDEPELEDQPQRLDSIPPPDAFPFVVSSSVVADRYLINTGPDVSEARSDLGLQAET